MLLRHAAATNVGRVRDHNEDNYAIEDGGQRADGGALAVVCDGMGGYERGEVASDVAAKTIVAHYGTHDLDDPAGFLRTAVAAANDEVLRQGNGEMGTTAVAAVLVGNVATVANVGDCRAYLVRDGKARQITRDHSFVAEQVAAGILTNEQAKESSYRHIVTRAIGHNEAVDVDVYQEELAVGDVLVLCSDGLHGLVEPEEIALAVTKVPLQTACERLVGLANKRGGPDNITIVAVKVRRLDDRTAPVTPMSLVRPSAATAVNGTSAPSAPAASSTQPPAAPASNGVAKRAVAAPARVKPPLARPDQRRSRGVFVWLATLLMVATVGFGGYSLWRTQPALAPDAPLAVPTLTPVGGMVATPDDAAAPAIEETAEPSPVATSAPRSGRTPLPTRTPTPAPSAN